MLESGDEKSEQCGSSKELEQLHQSSFSSAGEVKLSAGLDISSEQVEDPINDLDLIKVFAL